MLLVPDGRSAEKAQMRGFGAVEFSKDGDKIVFACVSADKAKLLLHKFARDMEASATAGESRWASVKLGAVDAPVLVREGIGSFLPAAVGDKVFVFTTPETKDPAIAFAGLSGKLNGAQFYDPAFRYPVYLDKFSSTGIGSWYGFREPGGFSSGKPNTTDDSLAYAKKHGLSLQPGGGYIIRDLLPKLQEYGRPFHVSKWLDWSQELAILSPDDLVTPGEGFGTMPHYYGEISDGGDKLEQLRRWNFQRLVRQLVHEPLLVDWNDPNGEVGPAPFFYYWDFSENNRRKLVHYLRDEKKYTLRSLGEAWHGDANRFKSWDDVPIPMGYDFFGWRKGDILAEKSWRVHPTSQDADAEYQNASWAQLKNAFSPHMRKDLAAGYAAGNFDDSGWAQFDRPGGDLSTIYFGADSKHFNKSFWRRGHIDVPADWLKKAKAAGRIYLNVISLNVNLGRNQPDMLWINGQEAASIASAPGSYATAQIDVTDLLKPGRNQITHLANLTCYSSDGPYFLTTEKMESYPFSDPGLNARYRDWRSYIAWAIKDRMEETYKMIRATDPDRPIKIMAAQYRDLTIPLAQKYGGYTHNTGEGAFFRPWDKRSSLSYGLPGSAEFPSPIVEEKPWKRWLGWFHLEGLNALDNFNTIQDMMYSPVADLWVKYLPYLKIANRREIKKPDLALFQSSENKQILPRGVPLCLDIGRGDLAFLGISNAYVDEAALRDGYLRDYPVVFDTGTWAMDKETVAGLKKYVEAGGTFVALQETGRHTFTQRDAWPIQDLTGFAVREIRPMEGTVSILADQPLFKALAGRNFDNRGKSVDYSGYNFADKCVALEPVAPDTTAIARYDDGSIAIGLRKLGKGRVIVLGSPFWRDSYDGAGMWWPGPAQNAFLADLLGGLGIRPVAKSDSNDIWREHYLANNGTEEFLALFNPFDTPRTFSIEWKTEKPVLSLVDPKDGSKVEASVDGTTVKLEKITLDGLETKLIAARTRTFPQAAAQAWFDQLVKWWRASASGQEAVRPDLPVYTLQLADTMKGKVVSAKDLASLDLPALSKKANPGSGFAFWAGQSPDVFVGKPDGERRVVLHASFELPKKWTAKDAIDFVINTYPRVQQEGYDGVVDAWLNGTKVFDHAQSLGKGTFAVGTQEMDPGAAAAVTKLLNFGGTNSLVVVAGQAGFMGEVKLDRRPVEMERLEIKGDFQVQRGADSGVGTAAIPGVVKGLYAWKEVDIPASWKGSRVFVDVNVADVGEYDSFAINNKVLLHPVGWLKPVCRMDVTPWIKFGQPNKLTLISRGAVKDWQPSSPNYQSVGISRVAADVR